ncbi:MAG: ribonuclease P protein component [Geminicoccaceae bacterium]
MGKKSHSQPEFEQAPAGRVVRLKRRSEFLATAASGRRWVAPTFILQIAPRRGEASSGGLSWLRSEAGLGFTASRRVGNAVARNRAKRRLREASRQLLPKAAVASHNYVLIARSAVLTCPFQTLIDDLNKAFERVLTARSRPPGLPRARRGSKKSH